MTDCDMSKYYIDFTTSTVLNESEKTKIMDIQNKYRPMERVSFLMDYKIAGKITDDEFEQLTGVPYSFC